MELTAQYLRERFRELNRQYFGGELPEPQLAVSNARTLLGQFSCRRQQKGIFGQYVNTNFKIKVSEFYNQSAEMIDDTLLHEMIHFYGYYMNLDINGDHEDYFLSMAEDINKDGYNVKAFYEVDY
jgi:hypothetical protein